MAEDSVATVTYWNGFGRGECVRMACLSAGIKVKNKFIETVEDFKVVQSTTLWGQAPILEIDGQTFTQSTAMIKHIARTANMYGETARDKYMFDTILAAYVDCYDPALLFYPWNVGNEDFMKSALACIERWFPKFEKIIEEAGHGCFIGKKETTMDYVFFGLWKYIQLMCEHSKNKEIVSFIENKCPKFVALMEKIGKIDVVADYVANDKKMDLAPYKKLVEKTLQWFPDGPHEDEISG